MHGCIIEAAQINSGNVSLNDNTTPPICETTPLIGETTPLVGETIPLLGETLSLIGETQPVYGLTTSPNCEKSGIPWAEPLNIDC